MDWDFFIGLVVASVAAGFLLTSVAWGFFIFGGGMMVISLFTGMLNYLNKGRG